MKKTLLAVLIAGASLLPAQVTKSYGPIAPSERVATDPATCVVSEARHIFNTTSNIEKYCSATNTWSAIAGVAITRYETLTWGICVGAPCATGTNLTIPNPWINTVTITKCIASGKTAPTGATLIVDILNAGSGTGAGTSIFGGGTKLVIATSATTATQATVANASATAGDNMQISITQVGSAVAGQEFAIKCVGSY